MGIYAVKPKFRSLLAGAARSLVGRGVTRDQVTAAGVVASGLGGLAFLGGRADRRVYAAVPLMAFGRIAANALDGLVAEEAGSGRPAGELYNETADRVCHLAFFAGAAAVPGVPPALAFGALALSELASFVGVTSKAAGGARRYDGPMGKPDRMFVLGAAALAASAGRRPARPMAAALALVAAGAPVTAWNRYRRAYRELSMPPATAPG